MKTSGKIGILLADDHVITREGIRHLLEEQEDFTVVGEASDGQEAVDLTAAKKPDVVIMDVAMPTLNGIQATEQIKAVYPRAGVLVLSAHDDDEYVFGLLKAGAAGYLLKNVSGDDLVAAIRAVYRGEPVLNSEVARKVMNYFRNTHEVPAVQSPGRVSERDIEIIRLAAAGMSNKDIADALHVSRRTIEGHFRAIFARLRVGSRTEAVLYGLKNGWFSLTDLARTEK